MRDDSQIEFINIKIDETKTKIKTKSSVPIVNIRDEQHMNLSEMNNHSEAKLFKGQTNQSIV
jgi:pimeloyl-CoA synthetase